MNSPKPKRVVKAEYRLNGPKPKRVVSKAEYARIMAHNGLLMIIASVCLPIGLVMAFVCTFALILYLKTFVCTFALILHWGSFINFLIWIFMAFPFGLSLVLITCGRSAFRKIENAEEVQLAPRLVAKNLPAPDILVRASDAPQTPETVLLRAAQETETPQEQLLRASE